MCSRYSSPPLRNCSRGAADRPVLGDWLEGSHCWSTTLLTHHAHHSGKYLCCSVVVPLGGPGSLIVVSAGSGRSGSGYTTYSLWSADGCDFCMEKYEGHLYIGIRGHMDEPRDAPIARSCRRAPPRPDMTNITGDPV